MFWKQTSARTLIILINQISILITTFYLANKLGLESFGTYATALVILQLFAFFLDGGFFVPAARELANNTNKLVHKVVWVEVYLSKLIIYTFIAIVTLSLNQYFNLLDHKVMLSTLFAALFYGLYPLWFYQINNKVNDLVLINLIARIIFVFLILMLVEGSDEIYIAILAQAASYALPLVGSIYYFRQTLRQKISIGMLDIKGRVLTSLSFFIGNNLLNQAHNFWGFMFIFVSTSTQIGIFQIADSCLRAGLAFTQALSDNLLIRHENLKKFDLLNFKKVIYILILISTCSFLMLDTLVESFMIKDYLAVIPVIQITILIWFVLTLLSLLLYPSLGALISYNKATTFLLFFGVINIFGMIGFYQLELNTSYELELMFLILSLTSLFLFLIYFYLIKLKILK